MALYPALPYPWSSSLVVHLFSFSVFSSWYVPLYIVCGFPLGLWDQQMWEPIKSINQCSFLSWTHKICVRIAWDSPHNLLSTFGDVTTPNSHAWLDSVSNFLSSYLIVAILRCTRWTSSTYIYVTRGTAQSDNLLKRNSYLEYSARKLRLPLPLDDARTCRSNATNYMHAPQAVHISVWWCDALNLLGL